MVHIGPGDGGDQYVGLDRFGRVVDQRWRTGTTESDRFVYTYDKDSNPTSKDVLGATPSAPGGMDEGYFYDNLNRLTKLNRGTVSGGTVPDGSAGSRRRSYYFMWWRCSSPSICGGSCRGCFSSSLWR